MARILVYKTAQGTIAICKPAPKEKVQQELSAMGRDAWIARHNVSLADATKNQHTEAINSHTQRLAWVEKVKDFDNLTDQEFEDFIHCSTPLDHVYHHWIDDSQLPIDRTYRDAWVDIDAQGNATHDLEKAKQIQIKLNAALKAEKQKNDELQAIVNSDALNNATITSLDDIKKGAFNG